ncbi:hypothetical protein DUNSADRAFT_11387 [Dunaliella salina]|uniref:Encoded protein n=1 Tax=Dunaliella salina TaxID=3046 RepID=A0ABQ7GDF3_DUNSA|nr:hypothetical protein DUNSADRAFT_11387 [Dunaliella salina]|eukprot:KAF5832642.1 hypothetical protein DUNSADRAFT_11387 [Dunaliella salina]
MKSESLANQDMDLDRTQSTPFFYYNSNRTVAKYAQQKNIIANNRFSLPACAKFTLAQKAAVQSSPTEPPC